MQKIGSFSLTGFGDKQIQNHFKQSLIKLGCNHIEKLAQTTNILVVNATWTQKFKIAQLNKNPISCVTKKWVEDSIKKKTLQALDKYLISEQQMFLGTNVAICGFAPDKLQKIQKIIKQRQGTTITSYKALDIIRKYSELPQNIDVILASNDEIERAKYAKHPALNDDILPLVRIQWLEDSLKRKRCKFPNDYAVNLLQPKPITANAGKLLKRLNLFIQNDMMQKSGDFLEDTLIYIDKELNMDFTKILKNLISVCGGYWTDRFTSVVTHVLLSEVDQSKYQQFKRYGSRIYILRPQWLVDSFLLYNRLQEEDYLIRCFKVTENIMRNLMQQQRARNNQNSQTFNSLPGFSDQRFPVSSNTLPMLQTEKKPSRTQVKSDIFKGRNFYLTPEIINDPLFADIIRIIKNAGGQIYDKINTRMYAYVVLKDSPKNVEIHDKIVASKYKCIIVSERWVKECVKKNSFMQPDMKVYFHFKAFKFCTPLGDFHKFVFEIVGYNNLSTLRIRELLQVLGSTRVNPNKSEITHILCGPLQNNQSRDKIRKILHENKKVKLINSSWLFQCTSEGKTVSFENYLIEDLQEDIMVTPQKKSEQNITNSENRTIEMEKLSP